MKRRWFLPVLCLVTLLLLGFMWTQPSASAGQARRLPGVPRRPNVPAPANPAATPAHIPLSAQGWTTLLDEDMEGDFPGTTWELFGDPTWGRTTYKAHSGDASAYCAAGGTQAIDPPGPYPDDMLAWMVCGPFDLSQAGDAVLTFQHWTQTEPDEWDQFWCLASVDGNAWDGTDWSGDWAVACGGWCAESISLRDFPGLGNLCGEPEVWLAFGFTTDWSNTFEGTYLDDILLRVSAEQPSESPTPSPTQTSLPAEDTPTPTRTSQPVCTPPPCQPGEVLYCPDNCPGGCGYRCGAPTATATPTQSPSPTPTSTSASTATSTATPTQSPSPTPTGTSTSTATPTQSPSPTRTSTPTATSTVQTTPTHTATPRQSGPSRCYLPIVQRPFPRPVSQVVKTNEEAVLQHASGASLNIPRGAVPKTASEQDGEMLFTIEQGTTNSLRVSDTPPTGFDFAGGVFAMGPEGFTFARAVELTLPVPASARASASLGAIFDYDREAGKWKNIGGTVSRDGTKITAAVQDLNSVYTYGIPQGGCSGAGEKGAGAIQFETVPGYSFGLCIESYTLKYPDYDRNFVAAGRTNSVIRRDSPQCPADGLVYWILPQGTYTVAVQVYFHRFNDQPPEMQGYFVRSVTITQPHYDWLTCMPGNFWHTAPFGQMEVNPANLTAGRAPCMGAPSPSVGVGSLNVRLEWNVTADLDLWVVDPCGQQIYYRDRSKTCQGSTGQLDLDNRCNGLVVGRPENIFWSTNPPRGTYKVYVDYYSSCGQNRSVPYTVRWWLNGTANSKSGTIQPPTSSGTDGDEVLAATFTY